MSIIPPISIMDKARKHIATGHIKECLDELLADLESLRISKPFVYKTRNDLLVLRFSYVRLENERRLNLVGFEQYNTQCNSISNSIIGLLDGLDEEFMKAPLTQPLPEAASLYKVELELDMDFETATDEDIQSVLEKIARIIQTKPNELTIMAKRKGSIVLEMELSAETFVKLKLLTNIGVVKELKNVNVTDAGGDGMYDKLLLLFLNGGGFSRFNLSGMDLRDADLNGSDFSGVNLSGVNLSGVNLSGAYLSGANLSDANLRDANLSGAYLSGANLSSANLRDANLSGAYLSGAYLSDADLSGAVLSGSKLRDTNLRGANLRRANLSGADLRRANISSANLSTADIRSAKLSSANLIGTKLTGANLSGANLSDTDLSGADLSVAKLSGADLSGASLSGADCTKTIFHVDQLELLQSMDVDISEAIFVDSDNGLNVESGAKAR